MKALLLAFLASVHLLGQPDVKQELLNDAASDFQANQSSQLLDIRRVHMGTIEQRGGYQYLLCGEFRVTSDSGKSRWMPFATIKTSAYEHWLGDQANALCNRPYIYWDKKHDLSNELKTKLGLK